MNRLALIAMISFVLSGCASSPFDLSGGAVSSMTPETALTRPEAGGERVIWGGRVTGIVNRETYTELEMVALPLWRDQRPRRNAEEGARFVIRQEGFLEPVTWAPGRFVTALGRFTGLDMRPVGAIPVRHAVMEAEQIELWPVNPNSDFSEFGALGRPPN